MPQAGKHCGCLADGQATRPRSASRTESEDHVVQSGVEAEHARKRRIEAEDGEEENVCSNAEQIDFERRSARQPPLGVVRQLCLEAAESRLQLVDSQRGACLFRTHPAWTHPSREIVNLWWQTGKGERD